MATVIGCQRGFLGRGETVENAAAIEVHMRERRSSDETYANRLRWRAVVGGIAGGLAYHPEQKLGAAGRAGAGQDYSLAFVSGAFQLAVALITEEQELDEASHSGAGVGWHERDHDLWVRDRAVVPTRLRRQTRPELDPRARR